MTNNDAPSFWTGKRALVTGATGLVGSWLVRALVDGGAQVVAFIRDADPQSELLRSGTINEINVVAGRLEDFSDVERAINDHEVDTVFHLGAQTIVGAAYRSPLQVFESNVRGTWHVLEAARVHSSLVERVVIASSDKAYGVHADLPYQEDMELKGRHPYDVSKSCADMVGQAYADTYGVPTTIARCGNVFGGGDLNWSRIVPGAMRALIRGEPLVIRSDGTYIRDYIYVEDAVGAYMALAVALNEKSISGEGFNFSYESPMTVMEMYEAVREATGIEGPGPVILGTAVAEIPEQYLSAAKARETLGWKPSFPLEEGLRRTYRWYQELLGGGNGEG